MQKIYIKFRYTIKILARENYVQLETKKQINTSKSTFIYSKIIEKIRSFHSRMSSMSYGIAMPITFNV